MSVPRHKILFLEDDETITYVMNRLLAPQYDVDSSHNLEDALELCQRNEYSLLLVDLVLRKIHSGHDFIRTVRKLDGYRNTPIVVHTALATTEDEEHCFRIGANAFLRRPTSNSELLGTIAKLIDN